MKTIVCALLVSLVSTGAWAIPNPHKTGTRPIQIEQKVFSPVLRQKGKLIAVPQPSGSFRPTNEAERQQSLDARRAQRAKRVLH